jgi:hypothetical protein
MNIIYAIIDQLSDDNYYGISENIEIVKGKYKIKTFRERLHSVKRRYFMFIRKITKK